MRALIAQVFGAGGPDKQQEAALVTQHHHHFAHRARPLDPAFFPGGEKSSESLRSLGNGAYASFAEEPLYEGHPAFHHVMKTELPALGFLYYWKNSATIAFLRSEGSSALKHRLNVMRSVRIHLHQGFFAVGSLRKEAVWWFEQRSFPPRRMLDPAKLGGALTGSGKAAIVQLMKRAEVPLTRAEIACALMQSRHEIVEEVLDDALSAPQPARSEAQVLAQETARRTRAFFSGLTPEERRVLKMRGYGEDGKGTRSFREVAERMGDKTPETWRLVERRVLKVFAEHFNEREEALVAAATLSQLLLEEVPA